MYVTSVAHLVTELFKKVPSLSINIEFISVPQINIIFKPKGLFSGNSVEIFQHCYPTLCGNSFSCTGAALGSTNLR